jgi:hypothetical protein
LRPVAYSSGIDSAPLSVVALRAFTAQVVSQRHLYPFYDNQLGSLQHKPAHNHVIVGPLPIFYSSHTAGEDLLRCRRLS